MSTGRQLPARDYLTLKAALRDLVEAAGGGARAAGHCRAGASLLSRYGAVQEEMQAPIDVIADLEAQVGDLVVTRALAALHGCVVVPDPALAVGAPDMARHLGRVARETGEVLAGIGAALADDGKVCAREAAALVPEVREATEALVQLGHDLDRIVTGAVVPLRPDRGAA